MSLNVTVTKGHDFTTGPVTRAALNAAATPTVSMTGSVSASEIADGAITGAKITGTDADAIPNSKVAVTSGSIVVGTGSPGVGSELAAGTSGQILVGNGSTLASVAVSGDATLSSAGALSIGNTKVTGAMLNAAIVDDATIEIDSASNSLKVKSIAATNIGSGSNGGVIGFNSSGVGANVAAGTSGYVLTSNGTSAAPSFQASPITSAIFTSNRAGTYHYKIPDDSDFPITSIRVRMVAGGGAGSEGTSDGGAGGGGGQFAEFTLAVSAGDVFRIVVGHGGVTTNTGSTETAGSNGGDSGFYNASGSTDYVIVQGGRGGGGVSDDVGGLGGSSATTTGVTDVKIVDGDAGGSVGYEYPGATISSDPTQFSGYGGSSFMGAGALGHVTSSGTQDPYGTAPNLNSKIRSDSVALSGLTTHTLYETGAGTGWGWGGAGGENYGASGGDGRIEIYIN